MNFNQVNIFYSDQGMIENSYLKSHIFLQRKIGIFFIISMKILTKILSFCYSLSIKKFYLLIKILQFLFIRFEKLSAQGF